MKALLIASLMTLAALNVAHSATDNSKSDAALKSCISKTYSNAANSSSPAKETLKLVSASIKDCRKAVSDIKKNESKAKKAAQNAKKIEKLKAQLVKLTSTK